MFLFQNNKDVLVFSGAGTSMATALLILYQIMNFKIKIFPKMPKFNIVKRKRPNISHYSATLFFVSQC